VRAALNELVDLLMKVNPVFSKVCTQFFADWHQRQIYSRGRAKHTNLV